MTLSFEDILPGYFITVKVGKLKGGTYKLEYFPTKNTIFDKVL